jgi:23S rRNA pseudouridine1911/1915/1917 synthase
LKGVPPMPEFFAFEAEAEDAGERLDRFVAQKMESLSRSAAHRLILSGDILVDSQASKPRAKLRCGQKVSIRLPEPTPAEPEAQDLKLEYLFRDEHIAVVNKRPAMAVHPAPGTVDQTLVNGLLFDGIGLSGVGGKQRPGIVHRLDKDTSGCMVVACHDRAHRVLSKAFAMRQVDKRYLCVTAGRPKAANGLIDTPFARHPKHRMKHTGTVEAERRARTRWTVLERLGPCALIEIELLTGRTHQIRVHMAEGGTPLVGDELYGGARRWRGTSDEGAQAAMRGMRRQALHAKTLSFEHPISGERIDFEAPVPQDFQALIDALRTVEARFG